MVDSLLRYSRMLVLDYWIGEGPLDSFAMGARLCMGLRVVEPLLWRAREMGNWPIPLITTPPPYMEDDDEEPDDDI